MNEITRQFETLRRSPDAPALTPQLREQLQSPKTVTETMRFDTLTPKDPEKAAEVAAKRRRDVIAGAFARDEAINDPDVLYPLALRVAYRLTRELARHLGWITYDELLGDLDAPAWNAPNMRRKRPGRRSRLCDAALDPISKAETLQLKGLPLLPPSTDLSRNHVELWQEAIAALVHHLNIPAGAPDDPDYGGLGLYSLVTYGWPTVHALIEYENILLEEVLDEVVKNGVALAMTRLRRRHGFMDQDVRGFIKAAKSVLRDNTLSDIEEERALMARKLEDLVRRAKDSLDLRTELNGLKQLGITLGVTRAEPEDDMTAFVRTVKRVANEAKEALPAPSD